MKKQLSTTKQAYDEIFDILNKHKDICVYDIAEIKSKAEKHLFGIELKEKYGLNIDPSDVYNSSYTRIDSFRFIGWYGEKYKRTISWEDNNKQPKDELLLEISFSTGAYIFGDDYPEKLFKQFWQELKSYKPKYTDTRNNNLYFSIDTASKIFNEFLKILEKYNEINKKDSKKRKIKKLQEEIKNLK